MHEFLHQGLNGMLSGEQCRRFCRKDEPWWIHNE